MDNISVKIITLKSFFSISQAVVVVTTVAAAAILLANALREGVIGEKEDEGVVEGEGVVDENKVTIIGSRGTGFGKTCN